MSEIKLKSNLKIIETKTGEFTPTADQLPKGTAAIGKINGKYKMFVNTDVTDGITEIWGGGSRTLI